MNDSDLIERLRRLQDDLLRICSETMELRAEAEARAKQRQLNEYPELRHITRVSRPDPKGGA